MGPIFASSLRMQWHPRTFALPRKAITGPTQALIKRMPAFNGKHTEQMLHCIHRHSCGKSNNLCHTYFHIILHIIFNMIAWPCACSACGHYLTIKALTLLLLRCLKPTRSNRNFPNVRSFPIYPKNLKAQVSYLHRQLCRALLARWAIAHQTLLHPSRSRAPKAQRALARHHHQQR